MAKPYQNREIDSKFNEAFTRMTEFDKDTRESLSRIETNMENGFIQVNRRLDTTNGKVKKIIVALVAVAAFSVGAGLVNINNIIALAKIGL